MTVMTDPLLLAKELLRFDTANPPGQEGECARFVGSLLEEAGFRVAAYEFAEGRPSIVARLMGEGSGLPLCFTGHLDTVPLGGIPWKRDPFYGEIDGGRLYGRGSSDMKGGVASMVAAGLEISKMKELRAGITFVITAGEETGSQGAEHLAGLDQVLGKAGAVVVAEPTSNELFIGHKGALWIEATTRGVAAHGSMPDQGENAIYKAADAAIRLRAFRFGNITHPLLGSPTLNVGMISGGTKINIVPDHAVLQIDIRTVPGQTVDSITARLRSALESDVEFRTILKLDPVATDPSDPWVREIVSLLEEIKGAAVEPRGAAYFTDAGVLTPAYDHVPTVILGPGDPAMAHKVDEYCLISRLLQAKEIYLALARRWCMN